MKRAIIFAAAALTLAGCSESGRVFGFDRGGPDEFTVVRTPPLSVPPDATLRPPLEGQAATDRDRSGNQARASLLASGNGRTQSAGTPVAGEGALAYAGPGAPAGAQSSIVAGGDPLTGQPTAPRTIPIRYGPQDRASAGEAALTQRVAAYYGIEPDIRRRVSEESVQVALEQEKFLYLVLFWLDPEPPGAALDANAESRRLRENEALGKPVNAGKAPVIARKKSGIGSLF